MSKGKNNLEFDKLRVNGEWFNFNRKELGIALKFAEKLVNNE